MKKLSLLLALAAVAGVANAQKFSAPTATATSTSSWTGGATAAPVVAAGSVYSNVTTYTNVVTNGGATNLTDGTNFIADDVNMTAAVPTLGAFSFTVYNTNAVSRAVNPFLGFYNMNTNGSVGSLITFVNFNAVTVAANAGGTFTANLATLGVALPQKIYIAEQFYKGTGASADLTLAQLNAIGMLIANPVDRGTSADKDALIDGATGAVVTPRTSPYSGNPIANYGFEVSPTAVPEPAAFAPLALGVVALVRRRKKA